MFTGWQFQLLDMLYPHFSFALAEVADCRTQHGKATDGKEQEQHEDGHQAGFRRESLQPPAQSFLEGVAPLCNFLYCLLHNSIVLLSLNPCFPKW
ncbi:unknown [Eggerthella sp. CAG:1427]|nr:unknown [Eggerthella sp. CAG:1427]